MDTNINTSRVHVRAVVMKRLLLLLLLIPSLAFAETYYVDSDWTGTHTGSFTHPWATLDASAWTAINAALSTDDVIIYFSARKSASDTQSFYHITGNDGIQAEVDLTKKTGSHTLILDGSSLFNTSEVTPYWTCYGGSNKCIVRDFNSQNIAHVKYSNVTIHGFSIICNAGTKAVAIAGDNWTVEYCDISHTSASTQGPCVLLVPTSDGAHGGSNSYVPPCNNIVIQNNTIHDTFGEAIYLGGGGSSPGTSGSGYPSHTNVLVLNNEIYNAGRYGGQGDGIDVKGGIQQLYVRSNNIHDCAYTDQSARGIVAQGQASPAPSGVLQTYERNYIHNMNHATEGMAIADTWGIPAGVIVRNNIINGVTGSSGSKNGISLYSSQNQYGVENNIVYGCAGVGMGTATGGSYFIRNNFVFGNHSTGNQVDVYHGTVDSDFNAYSTPSGSAREGSHSLNLSPTDSMSAVVNPVGGDFHLSPDSVLTGKGTTLTDFSDDYHGDTRTVPWDIGAYKAQ